MTSSAPHHWEHLSSLHPVCAHPPSCSIKGVPPPQSGVWHTESQHLQMAALLVGRVFLRVCVWREKVGKSVLRWLISLKSFCTWFLFPAKWINFWPIYFICLLFCGRISGWLWRLHRLPLHLLDPKVLNFCSFHEVQIRDGPVCFFSGPLPIIIGRGSWKLVFGSDINKQ